MARPNVPEIEDTEGFDDLEDYGERRATDPTKHLWATPFSQFNREGLRGHKCMDQIEQRGNYIHCRTGNHGMRIPQYTKLVRRDDGTWDLEDIKVLVTNDEGKVVKTVAPSELRKPKRNVAKPR